MQVKRSSGLGCRDRSHPGAAWSTPSFRFAELARLIDPSSEPKSDKPSILADAIKHVQQLRVENHQLKQLNKFLEERVAQNERDRGQHLYHQSLMMQHAAMLPGMLPHGEVQRRQRVQGVQPTLAASRSRYCALTCVACVVPGALQACQVAFLVCREQAHPAQGQVQWQVPVASTPQQQQWPPRPPLQQARLPCPTISSHSKPRPQQQPQPQHSKQHRRQAQHLTPQQAPRPCFHPPQHRLCLWGAQQR